MENCANNMKEKVTENRTQPVQLPLSVANLRVVVVAQYLGLSAMFLKAKRNKRRCWVRERLQERDRFGVGKNLVQEMRLKDNESFYNYVRMTEVQFDLLLHKVGPLLTKTSIRRPISERDRLLVTLRFVTTGMSYASLSYSFRIGKSTIHNIIKQTTQSIWIALEAEFIPKQTIESLRNKADTFFAKTGMPNCVGAIDGKHCTANRGSLSIVLLAVCDEDYNFTHVSVDTYGSESDGVLEHSDFGQDLLNNRLTLPEDEELPGSTIKYPFYFVGDEAFPLKRHLMRPYRGRNLSPDKRHFNKRLSSTRKIIETSFGMLASKFRIYHTVINARCETASSIVRSTVVLHNFILRTKSSSTVFNDNFNMDNLDNIGNWKNVSQQGSDHPGHEAQNLRDILKAYLFDE